MWESWWALLPFVETVWVIAVAVWILFERRSPLATVAWIMALSLLPVVGLLVYLLLGPRRFRRRKLRHAEAQDIARELGVRANDDLTGEASPPVRALMRLCTGVAGRPATPRCADLELFTRGEALFDTLERAIEQARHHVHMEYYIWLPDATGTRLRDCLAARAEQGVEVRVLVDGFGGSAATDRFWRPLRGAGGRVERFNPLSVSRWRPRLSNFRSHRKIAVIDGEVGFTGGMNITDAQAGRGEGGAVWRDTHLGLRGPATRGLQMVFCEGWYYATGRALDGEAYFPLPGRGGGDRRPLQIVASGPDENCDAIHKLYASAIAAAQRRVLLSSAYFVPDAALHTALVTAALRGVDVRVLVPAVSDLRVVAAASRSYYPELIAMGVRVFEYGPAMLHAKTLVVDDLVAVVGTANCDPRSFFLNFEVVAACYRPDLCASLARSFEQDLGSAVEVTRDSIGRAGLARRLLQNAARPLSPVL